MQLKIPHVSRVPRRPSLSRETTLRHKTVWQDGQVDVIIVDLCNSFVHASRPEVLVLNFSPGDRDLHDKTVVRLDTVRSLARGTAEVFFLNMESNLV